MQRPFQPFHLAGDFLLRSRMIAFLGAFSVSSFEHVWDTWTSMMYVQMNVYVPIYSIILSGELACRIGCQISSASLKCFENDYRLDLVTFQRHLNRLYKQVRDYVDVLAEGINPTLSHFVQGCLATAICCPTAGTVGIPASAKAGGGASGSVAMTKGSMSHSALLVCWMVDGDDAHDAPKSMTDRKASHTNLYTYCTYTACLSLFQKKPPAEVPTCGPHFS